MRRTEQGERGTGTVSALRNVLLGSAAGLALLTNAAVPGSAHAQAIPSQQGASQAIAFNIPAQDLGGALNAFADRAGLRLLFPSNLVAGRRSAGLAGTLTRNQALTRLLAGSGLTYRFTSANTVTIADPAPTPVGAAPAGAIALDTIDVQGAGNPNSTMSLPPAYAGGQVARGGQLGMLGNRDMMDMPFNQTVYTRKLIENQQARNLGDVLSNDPSVVKVFDSGGGFPRDQWSVRGVGANAQSVAFGGLFGIAQTRTGSMATETIERVEVLKGASALLNGLPPSQLANLGTVNLVPKRAGDEPLIAFTPDYAMNSQGGGHLDVGQRFGDNKEFGIRFNGVYRSGDTPILNNSRETRVTAFGFDYRGETVRLSLDLGYQNQIMRGVREIIYVDSGVPIPRPPKNTANWGQPWQSYNSEHKYATTRGEWDITENVTAYAAAGRSTIGLKTVENYLSVTDAAGTLLSAWYPAASLDYTQAATAEAGLRGRVQTGPVSHALALAAGWANEEYGFEQNAGTPLPASNLYNPVYFPQPVFIPLGDPRHVAKNSRNENLGFALADTLSILNERVQLMLGIRHQNVKQMSFSTGASYDASALSPAAALIVKPWENVSLYANFMEALQAGQIAPRTSLNAGEVFAPYKTTQYEVGAKVDFGRIAATLAAFTATRPTFALDPDTFIFGEVGKTRFQGIELTAFGQATETIRFVGGVTLMDATLVETPDGTNVGNWYGGIPKYRATLSMEWDTPFVDDLTLAAMGQYQSSAYFDDENTRKTSGWYRFDLNARYTIRQPGWKPIIVRATLRNVLDQSYWATTGYQLGLNEPRTFLLSTTFQF